MQSAIWPSTIPELYRHAASRLMLESRPEGVVERLRDGLGISQSLLLADAELIAAREAAIGDPRELDRLALQIAVTVGRQLRHEYPTSSLVWDAAGEEAASVLASYGHVRRLGGRWNRALANGRTIVVELDETFSERPDERRFTLRWGVVLSSVRFCRHAAEGHQLTCCAVAGGMGSLRPPHGDHEWLITSGMMLERGPQGLLRLVGPEGFAARAHRLATFCERISERGRLLELVSDCPWRAGIGIAERLRNADAETLQQLID
jgi:hypothetical protein